MVPERPNRAEEVTSPSWSHIRTIAAGGHPEKFKFTVFVRGHRWSSARYVNETLQEFAKAIQRNARRLGFIGEGDIVERLQLVTADGREPEDLDVDATLEDVIICMGSKHLVAIIVSRDSNRESSNFGELLVCPSANRCITAKGTSVQKPKAETSVNNYGLATSPPMGDHAIDWPSQQLLPMHKIRDMNKGTSMAATARSYEQHNISRRLMTDAIRDFNVIGSKDEASARNDINHSTGCFRKSPISRVNNFKGGPYSACTVPSPPELAQFFVRGASINSMRLNGNVTGIQGNCGTLFSSGNITPCNAGFQPMIRKFPLPEKGNLKSSDTSQNIAFLAQFLTSKLKAFVPACPESAAYAVDSTIHRSDQCSMRTLPVGEVDQCQVTYQRTGDSNQVKGAAQVLSGESLYKYPEISYENGTEKDESSSSANIEKSVPPSKNQVENECNMISPSELVFLVNRRSKSGIGIQKLRLSDLCSFFHLSVIDAAKKLGVSQTTLKKACRKFGLKRWPGRKVRSLESTIHGLEHTIAVGQVAGMEELTEAYIRSEVLKLQQEMHQLVNGIPSSQQSSAAWTADLYKRLYSRGWRSRSHSLSYPFDTNFSSAATRKETHQNISNHCNKSAESAINYLLTKKQQHNIIDQMMKSSDLKEDWHNLHTRGVMTDPRVCMSGGASYEGSPTNRSSSVEGFPWPEMLQNACDVSADGEGDEKRASKRPKWETSNAICSTTTTRS